MIISDFRDEAAEIGKRFSPPRRFRHPAGVVQRPAVKDGASSVGVYRRSSRGRFGRRQTGK